MNSKSILVFFWLLHFWVLSIGQTPLPNIEMHNYTVSPVFIEGHKDIPVSRVRALFIDQKQHLWLLNAWELHCYDGKNNLPFPSDLFIGQAGVPMGLNTCAPAEDGQYWVGHDYGLFKFNPENHTRKSYNTVFNQDYASKKKAVHAILQTSQNELFVRTHGLLLKYNKLADTFALLGRDTLQFKGPPSDQFRFATSKLVEDRARGGFWFSYEDGLAFYHYASATYFSKWNNPHNWAVFRDPKAQKEASELAIGSDGNLWFSILDQAAIYLFDQAKNTVERYGFAVKLDNGTPNAIRLQFLTPTQILYCSHYSGVYVFDTQTHTAHPFMWVNKNGVAEHLTTRVANSQVSPQGDLWLLFDGGIFFLPARDRKDDHFSTQRCAANTVKSEPCITSALYQGTPVALQIDEVLSVENCDLEFFVADKQAFFCKDQKWIYRIPQESNTWKPVPPTYRIRLRDLANGSYTLELRNAADEKSTTKVFQSVIAFSILPKWYQTKWFLLAVITGLIALGMGIQHLIAKQKIRELRRAFEKKEAIFKERERLSMDIHDDISSGLSAIHLLAKYIHKQQSSPDISSQVEQLSTLSSEVNQSIRDVIWATDPLSDTLENLVYYIKRYITTLDEVTPGVQVNYHVMGASEPCVMSGVVRKAIFLCVKEANHNAIKHAKATNITTTITLSHDEVTIAVSDDGVGIASEVTLGYGFRNMQKRMRLAHGTLQVVNEQPGICLVFRFPLEGR